MDAEFKPKRYIKADKLPTGIKGFPKRIWGFLAGAMIVISFVIEIFSTDYPTYILIGLALIILIGSVWFVIITINKKRKILLKKYNNLVTEFNALVKENTTTKRKLNETENELAETSLKLTLIEDELERTKSYLTEVEKQLTHHKTAEKKPVFSSGANKFNHWVIWDKYKIWFKNVGNGPALNIIGNCIYHTDENDKITPIQIEALQSGQLREFYAGNSKDNSKCVQISLEFSFEDTYGNKEIYRKRFPFK
ncbi:MAG: hypothetical protein KAS16_00165 [Thermoplasmata archaeon]|nr:hypothetical protein [Thermoplasmata archaeon]